MKCDILPKNQSLVHAEADLDDLSAASTKRMEREPNAPSGNALRVKTALAKSS